MLLRKIFENLHTVMGILALFEQVVMQILVFCPLALYQIYSHYQKFKATQAKNTFLLVFLKCVFNSLLMFVSLFSFLLNVA